ncbi:uncharacterized protein BDR25DRAFT_350660 [Lindgomyces ingoldianus]|uniref:Uncharacterized protein n=1 Tax=Lindgomyces ingoldianus TaxID=673940 RepID=A0ACB6R9S4_9PLEO|nr:uncharacterized protein BDR25DRAFT_350660 [Lindgomyces ingoldianus]KAF2475272.1 hypothetical protein BDR25DRAFT_350660 [Lindgomyces ingoldianus]
MLCGDTLDFKLPRVNAELDRCNSVQQFFTPLTFYSIPTRDSIDWCEYAHPLLTRLGTLQHIVFQTQSSGLCIPELTCQPHRLANLNRGDVPQLVGNSYCSDAPVCSATPYPLLQKIDIEIRSKSNREKCNGAIVLRESSVNNHTRSPLLIRIWALTHIFYHTLNVKQLNSHSLIYTVGVIITSISIPSNISHPPFPQYRIPNRQCLRVVAPSKTIIIIRKNQLAKSQKKRQTTTSHPAKPETNLRPLHFHFPSIPTLNPPSSQSTDEETKIGNVVTDIRERSDERRRKPPCFFERPSTPFKNNLAPAPDRKDGYVPMKHDSPDRVYSAMRERKESRE